MSDQPKVSIVVLNWNGLPDTRECLRSLKEVSYPNCEVIVVDNGSQGDDAAALRREFGGFVHLIESDTNRGVAGGWNMGIGRALEQESDYVLLLNNDTVVDRDFLSEMVAAAQDLPDLAAACPKAYFYHRPDVVYSTGGRVSLWRGTARQVGRGEADRGQFDQVAPRDYADGVCMLIPRGALERVGLFDEEYFAYWEETDWCLRARALGLRCYYVPAARIWHKAARSLAPSNDFYYLYRRNALLFVRKRGKPVHLMSALLMHAFVYAPLYLLRHPGGLRRAPAELKALLWNVRNLARHRPLL